MPSTVVVAGSSPHIVGALERMHGVISIAGPRQLESTLAREAAKVVVIACDRATDDETSRDLARCAHRLRMSGATCIVAGAADVDRMERALEGVNHYICPGQPEPPSIGALVGAALSDGGPLLEELADWIAQDPELLSFFRTLDAHSGVDSILSHLESVARRTLRADGCRCRLVPDPLDTSLGDRALRCSTGLSGFVAMTGEPASLRAGTRDPRWHAPIDAGRPDPVHFMAVPVPSCGRRAFGVLTAFRSRDAEPFSDEDLRRARTLAACAAPIILAARARSLVSAQLVAGAREAEQKMFRPHDFDREDDSHEKAIPLVAHEPTWLLHAFWVCLVSTALFLSVLSLKSVDESLDLPFVITAAHNGADGDAGGDSQLVAALPSTARERVDLSRLSMRLMFEPGTTASLTVSVREMTVTRVSRDMAGALGLPRVPGTSSDLFVVRAPLPRRLSTADGASVELHAGMTGVARFTGGSHPLLFDLLPEWLSSDSRAGGRTKS